MGTATRTGFGATTAEAQALGPLESPVEHGGTRAQYAQLIARRVRELGVYCEIHPNDVSDAFIREFAPKGIILSGSHASTYEEHDLRAPQARILRQREVAHDPEGRAVLNRVLREAAQEPLVARDQALEGFVGGDVRREAHGRPIMASITWISRIFMIVPVGYVIA